LGWPRLAWYKILGIALGTAFERDRADRDDLGMPNKFRPITWSILAPSAALLTGSLLVAGCSGSIGTPVATTAAPAASAPAPQAGSPPAAAPAAPAGSPSFKDRMSNFFSSKSDKSPQPVTNAQPDVECPFIDIRQGASTLVLPPPPPDGSNEAMTLKYQGSFVRAARECSVVNGQMVMKVGIQGRVIVGPAGGPGHVDVPLRIAVVDAPSSGTKVITTKFIQIPVDIADSDGANFSHIEEGLSFPLPTPVAQLDNYVVYIGFDQFSAQNAPKAAPPARAKPKAKPNPNAPTG
jgi:hypothetical protein